MKIETFIQAGKKNYLLLNQTRLQNSKLQVQADFNLIIIFASLGLFTLLLLIIVFLHFKTKNK